MLCLSLTSSQKTTTKTSFFPCPIGIPIPSHFSSSCSLIFSSNHFSSSSMWSPSLFSSFPILCSNKVSLLDLPFVSSLILLLSASCLFPCPTPCLEQVQSKFLMLSWSPKDPAVLRFPLITKSIPCLFPIIGPISFGICPHRSQWQNS